MTVPFSLGGSAVSGVAYSGVTASPLTFGIGQTSLNITGTLLPDPSTTQTLTFTMGTPTGGASLGSPSANTLIITEPTAVQFIAGERDRERGRRHVQHPRHALGHLRRHRDRAVHARRHRGLGRRVQRRHGRSADVQVGQTTQDITGTLLPDPGPTRR